MSVVTLSRQLGSLGTEMAQSLAKILGYEYVDKETIGKALMDYGLPEFDVERFDEKKPPLWDSLQIQRRKFLHLIQAVIYDFARRGKVVIVGRGGQVLLKDLSGVLHIRVMAPLEIRLLRIREDQGLDEKQAIRILRRNDRDSAGFIRSFFDVDWADPDLYDLVISTRKISVERGVDLMLGFVRSFDFQAGRKKDEEKLADLALVQKVEAALLGILGIDVRHVNIQVEAGEVTLRGAVGSQEDKDHCRRAVSDIQEVKRVNNQLLVTQYTRFSG